MPTVRPLMLTSFVFVALAACSTKEPPADATPGTGAAAGTEAPVAAAVPAGDPTAEDFLNYELTMDKMRKWAAVTKGFSTISPTGAEAAEFATVKLGSEPITASEKKIDQIPSFKRIFTEAGVTPREYHMIMGAYGVSQMPTSKNAEFVKAHKAELEKLTAEINSANR